MWRHQKWKPTQSCEKTAFHVTNFIKWHQISSFTLLSQLVFLARAFAWQEASFSWIVGRKIVSFSPLNLFRLWPSKNWTTGSAPRDRKQQNHILNFKSTVSLFYWKRPWFHRAHPAKCGFLAVCVHMIHKKTPQHRCMEANGQDFCEWYTEQVSLTQIQIVMQWRLQSLSIHRQG